MLSGPQAKEQTTSQGVSALQLRRYPGGQREGAQRYASHQRGALKDIQAQQILKVKARHAAGKHPISTEDNQCADINVMPLYIPSFYHKK